MFEKRSFIYKMRKIWPEDCNSAQPQYYLPLLPQGMSLRQTWMVNSCNLVSNPKFYNEYWMNFWFSPETSRTVFCMRDLKAWTLALFHIHQYLMKCSGCCSRDAFRTYCVTMNERNRYGVGRGNAEHGVRGKQRPIQWFTLDAPARPAAMPYWDLCWWWRVITGVLSTRDLSLGRQSQSCKRLPFGVAQ